MKDEISYINIHTHKASEKDCITILNLPCDRFSWENDCSLGIHPWYINQQTVENDLKLLQSLSISKNVLAIGECGLDKLINTDLKVQESVFKSQIAIAESVRKPLIIHCVKAFDDLIRIKKELKISVPIIVHGFNNKKEIAAQLLKNGFYLSIGKALLNENSNASKNISSLPIEKIFLETDDADVSIKSIFEAAAKQLQIDLQGLEQQIHTNFKKVFNHE